MKGKESKTTTSRVSPWILRVLVLVVVLNQVIILLLLHNEQVEASQNDKNVPVNINNPISGSTPVEHGGKDNRPSQGRSTTRHSPPHQYYYNATEMAAYVKQFPTLPMKEAWISKCIYAEFKRTGKDAGDVKFWSKTNMTRPRRAEEERCLVHLHIGKNGGTALDSLMSSQVFKNDLQDSGVIQGPYFGNLHFDWSYLLETPPEFRQKMDVITMLRHPVKRAISHFYFAKQLAYKNKQDKVAKGMTKLDKRQLALRNKHRGAPAGIPRFLNVTISELVFSNDPNVTFFEDRDIWQDGQASVSWLTGTHIASWARVPKTQVPGREALASELDKLPLLLHLAADRLEQTLWFGILEDLDRSMELLSYALGRTKTREQYSNKNPLKLPQSNKGKIKHPDITQVEEEALTSLVPQDLWLYEYAQRLFEARWEAYISGSTDVFLPERPPIPELTCWSTRFTMNCTSGPLKGTYRYSKI